MYAVFDKNKIQKRNAQTLRRHRRRGSPKGRRGGRRWHFVAYFFSRLQYAMSGCKCTVLSKGGARRALVFYLRFPLENIRQSVSQSSDTERSERSTYSTYLHTWAWGGKGTVTPLLKGKVRIPPPAGHFIDPPFVPRKIFIDPPFVTRNFFPYCKYKS